MNGSDPVTTTIRGEDAPPGNPPNRLVPEPPNRPAAEPRTLQRVIDQSRQRSVVDQLTLQLNNRNLRAASRSRSRARPQRFVDTEPFVYEHSRDPENTRKHLIIIPSWGIKAEDRRGMCNICFEEDTHLQIKCKNCSCQVVCCSCVIGVYRYINPCPMCRHKGEE